MTECVFGECRTEVGKSPFIHAVIDNLLDTDFYKELEQTFPLHLVKPLQPGRETYRSPGKSLFRFDGKSNAHIERFETHLHGPWLDFFRLCQSGAFCELVERTFRTKFDAPGLQFELSAISANGGAVSPHHDSGRKAVSGIFYMPPHGWEKKWGGALELLRYSGADNPPMYPTWKQVKTEVAPSYRGNRLVLFKVKKLVSFHGVRPMSGPDGVKRKSITFALMREGK